MIEFADFQCPFCAQTAAAIRQLLQTHPGQIHFIFRHFPLEIHPRAMLAHEAAIAAAEQGRFWEMHDLLMANQNKVALADVIAYARSLGLDVHRFMEALKSRRVRAQIHRDLAEAQGLGVVGTPTIFINGKRLFGAQSTEKLQAALNRALGLPVEAVKVSSAAGSRAIDPKLIEIAKSPMRGSAEASVTIAEFSDFQCPFCARALPTVLELLRRYPGRAQLVHKNFPLDFHLKSRLAHQAALAAGEQGKFWEMHDRIFSHQSAIGRDDLILAGKELGLDMPRFIADMDSARFKAVIDADISEGQRLGVTGTPTFFVNGKEIVGASSLGELERVVDDRLQAAGQRPGADVPTLPSSASGSGNSLGAPGGSIRLEWYSDLESQLSPRAYEVVERVIAAYPGKVLAVFKNRPLEFHKNAVLAHEAAAAAAAQGKFWEMQRLILANQSALSRSDLINYANFAGLDVSRFTQDLDQHRYRAVVEDDLAEARRLQIFASPVFLVNGIRVDGVQELSIRDLIEAQLKGIRLSSKGGQ